IKKQGKRTDLTSTQVGQKSWSVNQVAEKVGDSRNQIQRYIRLMELIPPLLNLVDEKLIAFNPAVEISYLPKKEQEALLTTMQSEDRTPSLSQCQRLRKLSAEGRLDMDAIFTIMTEEKGNQKEQVKFGIDDLRQFFPKDYDPQRMQKTIIKLLEEWQRKRQRQREEQSRGAR
ncbi:MAG: chromosome partitioning protein ParB, partial [Clostridiales bacterium]|nr:chromosome partitioning protein ParB [Clostridiales bacterium]